MRRPRAESAVRVIPLGFLALFFAAPTATLIVGHLEITALGDVVTDSALVNVAWFSLWQGALSTALTLALGLPATWALTRWRFAGVRALATAISIPFLMPAVVMATGVAAVLPSRGIPAILWAHVAFNLSVVVRIVGPTWAMLDHDLEDSAASLGAGPWRTFRCVTWPAICEPARHAGALTFIFCATSFAVVSILGGVRTRTIESEIFTQAVRLGSIEVATALAVLQAIVIVVVIGLGRLRAAPIESAVVPVVRDLSSRRRLRALPVVVAVGAVAVACAPLVAVVIRSIRYQGAWNLSGWRALTDDTLATVGLDVADVARTTSLFAATTATLTVLLALAACARQRVGMIERLSLAPLVVSSVTLGLGLIVTFDASPVDWRARSWLIPVVHTVVALPLAVRIIGPALRTISDELLVTAADLGAGPMSRWWHITLPLLRPALARAGGVSAAVSVGEFGATSFLTRSGSTTVSIAIGDLMGRPGPILQQAAFALTTATTLVIAAGAASARIAHIAQVGPRGIGFARYVSSRWMRSRSNIRPRADSPAAPSKVRSSVAAGTTN